MVLSLLNKKTVLQIDLTTVLFSDLIKMNKD